MVTISFEPLTEAKKAAAKDRDCFWDPKITDAKSRGKRAVSNFGWWSCGRSDPAYIDALKKQLGKGFKVEYVKGQWGGEWTQVSW